MTVKSRANRFLILFQLFFVALVVFFIFITIKVFSKTGETPIGILVFLGIILSLSLTTSVAIVVLLKQIILTDEKIIIHYTFSKKYYEYHYDQVRGYDKTESFDSSGRYKSFTIKMSDGKTFLISSREFQNFDEILEMVMAKTKETELGFTANLKLISKIFVVCFLITFVLIWILRLFFENGY